MDSRDKKLADILVHHAAKVQPGQRVLLDVSDLSQANLIQGCYRLCLQAGADVEIDVCGMSRYNLRSDAGGFAKTFITEASDTQLATPPGLMQPKIDWAEVIIRIMTVHDPLFLEGVDPERMSTWSKTTMPFLRTVISDKTWVLTKIPTEGLAKQAGMTHHDLLELYYAGCFIDYQETSERIQVLQDILDAGSRVYIQGEGIDVTLGIDGRLARGAEVGRRNIPDGECFVGPEESVTEGSIQFDWPQLRDGHSVEGLRLEFSGGKITNWNCKSGEEYFAALMDADPDNKRLGELGIGMNTSIDRYTGMILLDEKIYGTVHFALGRSYESKRGGGKNGGTIHWDLVKDLRHCGSHITVDGKVIFEDGEMCI